MNSRKSLVLTVDTMKGQGVFTTIEQATNVVLVNNTNLVTINVKLGIYRLVIS